MSHLSRRILIFTMAVGVAGGAPAQSSHPVSPRSAWSERGVFAFNALNFDFQLGRFGSGSFGGPLSDCSNASFYCMNSRWFRLALPRRCSVALEARVGTSWSQGPVRTYVLFVERASPPPLHSPSSQMRIYLGNPEVPHVVYRYSPATGVDMIIWDLAVNRADSPPGQNFVALARSGRMGAWLNGYMFDPQKANRVYALTTFDRFGPCSNESPL